MAFSFNPSPAIIWPAPENCENSISVVPISIVPDVLQTNPKCLFSVPFSTNVKLPFISLSLLISFVLIQAPVRYHIKKKIYGLVIPTELEAAMLSQKDSWLK